MAAFNKLECRFALANAAVAEYQHALAVNLDKHAVSCYPLSKLNTEI